MREQRPSARILIADDHRLFADACKNMLEPEFEVVGIVTDGSELLDLVATLAPDIVLLASNLASLYGPPTGEQIKCKRPRARLVYVTSILKASVAAEAFRMGASACVPTQAAGQELLVAIRKVASGRSYLSPLFEKDAVNTLLTFTQPVHRGITPRQSQVLSLLAAGMSMKEVANRIDITVRTVAYHKYTMMRLLDITTTAELIRFALQRQMLLA